MEKIRFRQLTFFDQKTIKGNYFPHDETAFMNPGWIRNDGGYQYDRILKGIKFDKSSKEVAIDYWSKCWNNYKTFMQLLQVSLRFRTIIN